jgi:predicted MFS family arabinose efflux permease
MILTYGWRISYIVLGGVLLVIIIVSAQFLKRDPSKINQLPFGADEAKEEKSMVNARGLSFMEALSSLQFWLIFVIFFCFSMSANTLMVHLVPHVTDLGISPTVAATTLVTLDAASLVGSVGLGGLGDRLGNKRLFLMTFILLALALGGLIFIRQLWLLYLIVTVFGLGYGAGLTQESPIVANMFGLRSHGLIFGVVSVGHTMGAAVGTFLAGYFYDITGGYQLTFLICGVTSVIGLVLVLVVRPVKSATH